MALIRTAVVEVRATFPTPPCTRNGPRRPRRNPAGLQQQQYARQDPFWKRRDRRWSVASEPRSPNKIEVARRRSCACRKSPSSPTLLLLFFLLV